jgi:hypothetical protein
MNKNTLEVVGSQGIFRIHYVKIVSFGWVCKARWDPQATGAAPIFAVRLR